MPNVIAFPVQPSSQLSLTEQQFDEIRAGINRLAGEWRVEKAMLGAGCAYALLIPSGWGDGESAAFDIFRKGEALTLIDYRRTEFFGGREHHEGTHCGAFLSVDALCDALADLVGVKRSTAEQPDLITPSHSVA
jgi:hypothetical protein